MHKWIIPLCFLSLFVAAPCAAAKRLALVIGNSSYRIASGYLPNASKDALAIAAALRSAEFEVIELTDIKSQREFEQAAKDFIARAPGQEVALFFYSGHGVQVDGQNYLLPTDEAIDGAYQIKYKALNVSYLIDGLSENKPHLSVVILDACRDNPFPKSGKGGAEKGMGRMDAPNDMLIAYATAPNQTANDGDGAHSPYAQALLDNFQRAADVPIPQFFNNVGIQVVDATGGKQSPRLESSPLHHAYCFRHCNDVKTDDVVKDEQRPHDRPKPSAPDPYGIRMIPIKGGRFLMGSPDGEAKRGSDERQHEVVVGDFELAATEVTQAQWRAVMGGAPPAIHFKNCGDDCPVEGVSWDEVQAFIAKLNEKTGGGYRLPNEAEWEYAARAGDVRATYNGELTIKGVNSAPELDAIAWYSGNSGVDYGGGFDCSGWPEKQYRSERCGPHPVKQKRANVWGLYDMLGNVWEWTCSGYDKDYQGGEQQCIGNNDAKTPRVFRGGSWDGFPTGWRSAERYGGTPDVRDITIGFRLARM